MNPTAPLGVPPYACLPARRIATGFLSAFLDNVTTMLLLAPVSISLMRQCNLSPIPLLMAQVCRPRRRCSCYAGRWLPTCRHSFLISQAGFLLTLSLAGVYEQHRRRSHHGGRPPGPHHWCARVKACAWRTHKGLRLPACLPACLQNTPHARPRCRVDPGTALSATIGFIDFIINMAPGVLMASVACIPLILFIYRGTLLGKIADFPGVLEEVKGFRITDWDLMAKCCECGVVVVVVSSLPVHTSGCDYYWWSWGTQGLMRLPSPLTGPLARPAPPPPRAAYVTGCVLVGFLLHPVHHVDPAWFAVFGAIVLCVCDKPMEVENVIKVRWRC